MWLHQPCVPRQRCRVKGGMDVELREQWKAKRDGFADLVSQHADTSEAIGRAFAALLDEMRLSLMGAQANVLKRQCIGLLFAQAQAGAQWLGSSTGCCAWR